ncbi:ribokinase [Tropicimonas sp. IMCC6043]|uniref:ribokinase n=1 Tax=Tropicimonas sp. IMCC6043 TaxID=2510645 RepID=UPI00101BB9A6|nr:ribokinase [Tropicimonas sp. IMCC6043]RYH10859.1 ribokinase [Tropicimonas sp. IMCC6043]
MAIYSLGAINADSFYRVDRCPLNGETVVAHDCSLGLGGKGVIQSVAAARAGSQVHHIGSVGDDGVWAVEQLKSMGVDVTHVAIELGKPSGHALIFVEPDGENRIVIYPGTNRMIEEADVKTALARAQAGDMLLLQNETNAQLYAARRARSRGMRVAYSAAPLENAAVNDLLPFVDLLLLSATKAESLSGALGVPLSELPVAELIVTEGAKGATWHDLNSGETLKVSAPTVDPVDTTGAGDTFAGYFCAGRDQGAPVVECLELAVTAAALKVTRAGTSEAIPTLDEVRIFRSEAVTAG